MENNPLRRIITKSFDVNKLCSYGIVLYCKSTKRWVMVRRKHSIEYVMLFKGYYENSMVPVLLKGMTSEEIANVKRFLGNSQIFYHEIRNITGKKNYRVLNHCHDHFVASRPIIIQTLRILEEEGYKFHGLQWEWPKGMSNKNETGYESAMREFSEEVGFDLGELEIPSENVYQLRPFQRNYTDKIIELHYWLVLVDEEFPIYDPGLDLDNNEVSERKWMSEGEVYEALSIRRSSLMHNEPMIVHASEQLKCIFETCLKLIYDGR